MNKQRRADLDKAIDLLSDASKLIEDVAEGEQDSMDNMPENLQESERYSVMEDTVDGLQDALEDIQKAIDTVIDAKAT